MSALGMFGALAQGYTEAAKARRDQNLALGEHQRDLQIGLLDKLLSDPSTPEEYKGTLLQQRIATTNANQYDKNGILKLPSLDDMRQQLPPVQRPATPGPTSMPPVQLGVPQPPPGMDTGSTQEPPSASLPASGIQKPAGSASVPPALPPPSPVTLPSTPLTMPSPPPIAEAGQFHPLTEHEQIARKTQLALDHAKQLIQNGVPAAQAYVAAGLMPKPELHNIPFLGSAINPYTGEQVTGPATRKPLGTPITFVDPQTQQQVTMQRYMGNDGNMTMEPVPDKLVKPITPLMDTTRTSNTTDEFGTKSSTTSKTSKVLPGGNKTITKPTAPVSTETSTGGGTGAVNPSPTTMREGTKKAVDDVVKAAGDARKQINLLDSAEKYVQEGKFDSAGDLSLIVQAVRAMNPGTVRLPVQEIQMELKRGTYGDQFRRWYAVKVDNGVLPPDQREQLMNVLRRETNQSGQDAAQGWQQTFGNKKPLPPHLQRFGQAQSGAIMVPDPEGGKHYFKTQAEADNFKQLAGIK